MIRFELFGGLANGYQPRPRIFAPLAFEYLSEGRVTIYYPDGSITPEGRLRYCLARPTPHSSPTRKDNL